MDDTKQMLKTIINGQSLFKSELLTKIDNLDKKLTGRIDGVEGKLGELENKMDKGFRRVEERLDKIGMREAFLEDDAPTVEEFDKLEKRVTKIEQKVASI